MRNSICLFILSIVLLSFPLHGQPAKPDSAQNIIKSSVTKAHSSKKNVLLIFHATWCKWCKRLETALNDPEINSVINKHYIVTMLDVKERGDKIQTYENPGGQKLLSGFKGDSAGLPFVVFLNGDGNMIANSNVMPQEQNIGYPGSPEEITAFIELLKRTAAHITNKQCTVIKQYLVLHAPK